LCSFWKACNLPTRYWKVLPSIADVSVGDKAKIEKLINDLAKKEQKLYEVINFVEKYSMLVDVFGEDAGQKTVSVADMEKAVNARSTLFAKKVKRENDIISVLKTLTEALQIQSIPESNTK
jgi:phosphotransacetylase